MNPDKSFIEVVNDEKFKEALVRVINFNIDIPFLPESVECVIFKAIVESMLFAFKEYSD